jgi:YD repeat-containing protein
LYYEPRRESVVFDSDEEVRGGDNANAMWSRRQATQYVYDAAAERTAQHLREGRVTVTANGVH